MPEPRKSGAAPAPEQCGRPAVGRFQWGPDGKEGYLCAQHREDILRTVFEPYVMNHTALKPNHGKTCTEPPFKVAPALPAFEPDDDDES